MLQVGPVAHSGRLTACLPISIYKLCPALRNDLALQQKHPAQAKLMGAVGARSHAC